MSNKPSLIGPTALLSTRSDQLPPHIAFDEYQRIRQAVRDNWLRRKETAKTEFYQRRDLLFVDLLWATGARVGDLCRLPVSAIDFERHRVRIDMQKAKRPAVVSLDSDLLLTVRCFIADFEVRDRLFGFNRAYAHRLVRRYAEEAGLKGVHPHKFRHGLAVHLLQQGVPIPVISARLGHASVYVTMSMYMKVTPEIQAEMVKDVRWR